MTQFHRWVTEHRVAGWAIESERGERVSGYFATQHAALERARALVAAAGGGQITVRDRHGATRDVVTVPAG